MYETWKEVHGYVVKPKSPTTRPPLALHHALLSTHFSERSVLCLYRALELDNNWLYAVSAYS